MGDAGAVTGSDSALLAKVRELRQYGWTSKYSINREFGRNSRLDEIQAAVLRLKLPYLQEWNETRRKIFGRYLLSSGSRVKFFSKPNESFVGHLCPITVESYSQKELSHYFQDNGVSTSIHFPLPDNYQAIELKHRSLVSLPVTEWACSSLVTIPIFPELTEKEIDIICRTLEEIKR
jgi:dTDP-4-amino-4,6-dideoxygalactose transaminase